MSPPADRRTATGIASDLGVLALAIGTAVSFRRIFIGWGWLADLLVIVVGSWLTARALRRAGLATLPATALHVLAGIVLLGWLFVPGHLVLGLPGPGAWTEAGSQIASAFEQVSDLVAPVAPLPGFLIPLGATLWVLVGFADTAASRYSAPVQAAVPPFAVFVAAGVLARETGRIPAAVAFGAGLAVYAVTQRLQRRAGERWISGERSHGLRATAVGAGALLVGATLATALAWPFVPVDDEPVLDLREIGRGAGPRTVVSPFVGIRSMLGERSGEIMFTVRAAEPAYWRLTALDQFDPERDIWISRSSYQDVRDELPQNGTTVAGTELVQEFRLAGLSTLWLPAAYAPRDVGSDVPLSFDAASSSLIVRDGDVPGALRYTVTSQTPTLDSLPQHPAQIDPSQIEVPELSPAARTEVERFRSYRSPAERMLELQNWFREFTYDETVDYSGDADPLLAFLESRRGFCQQFASAFALFARELGVPSRVAVGFTPGESVTDAGEVEGAGDGEYVVRGRNAHAWPEVQLPGVGWVAFEPTPQRGNPQAMGYTGVPPQQAPVPPTESDEGEPSTTTTPTTAPEVQQDQLPTDVAAGAPEAAEADEGSSTAGVVLAMLLVGFAVAVVTVLVVRDRRARSGLGRHRSDHRVARAWHDVVASLAALGIASGPSSTPRQVVELARDVLDDPTFEALAELGQLEERRRWAPAPLDDADADRAELLLQDVADRLAAARRAVGAR